MKFFVRNMFTKMLLLAAFSVPLFLYALNELRQMAQAGGDVKDPPPATEGADLESTQNQAAKLFSMPADLHKELIFPAGGPVNVEKAGPDYAVLASVVKERARILAGHKSALEQCADVKNSGTNLKYLGPSDLEQTYKNLFDGRRKYFALKGSISSLREELAAALAKSDKSAFEMKKDELLQKLKELSDGWDKDTEIPVIREEVARRDLEFDYKLLMEECQKKELSFQKLLGEQLSAVSLETMFNEIDNLHKRLLDHEGRQRTQAFRQQQEWALKQIDLWKRRHAFLPPTINLIKQMERALDAARIDEFLGDCATRYREAPSPEAGRLVRSLAEEYCTKLLEQPSKAVMKYDDYVLLTGSDNKVVKVPRKQVWVTLSEGKGRWLEDANSVEKSSYTEFELFADKSAKKISGYPESRAKADENLKDLDLTALQATPKSIAVHLYWEEYKRVVRWNAPTIRELHRKCKEHKRYFGDVWDRLDAIAQIIDKESMRDLFPR